MSLQPAQFSAGVLAAAGVGAGRAGAVAGAAEPPAGASVSASPDSLTAQATINGGREDLTVFFSIGMVVDVFLVMAFLAWAVGQWRKTKK
jgi:hypothetical protein